MSDASPVLLTPDVVGGLAGKRVLVVGDIMLDAYLIGDADRISPEAPVPVVRIEKERYLLGGAGNVARNIVALGGVATLAGVMGKDASADRIRGLVRDEGICGRVRDTAAAPDYGENPRHGPAPADAALGQRGRQPAFLRRSGIPTLRDCGTASCARRGHPVGLQQGNSVSVVYGPPARTGSPSAHIRLWF